MEPGVSRCRSCACSDTNACPGGCTWVEPDLCSRCAGAMAQLAAMADTFVALEVPMLALTAVHGNLCLALRHPENTGPSRAMVEEVIAGLEEVFLRAGVFTEQQLERIRAVERDAQPPRVILVRGCEATRRSVGSRPARPRWMSAARRTPGTTGGSEARGRCLRSPHGDRASQ